MATGYVYDAVRVYLEQNWDRTPLAWENEDFVPPASDPWVFVEVLGDSSNQASIGAGDRSQERWRDEGEVLLHVLVRTGTSSRQARRLADDLEDLFRGANLDDLEFRSIRTGRGVPDEDGNWYRISICIDWLKG